jgi:hypothetical protein
MKTMMQPDCWFGRRQSNANRALTGGSLPNGQIAYADKSFHSAQRLPVRRRERAMLRFPQMKSLQNFVSAHASLHDRFASEPYLADRQTYKQRHTAPQYVTFP